MARGAFYVSITFMNIQRRRQYELATYISLFAFKNVTKPTRLGQDLPVAGLRRDPGAPRRPPGPHHSPPEHQGGRKNYYRFYFTGNNPNVYWSKDFDLEHINTYNESITAV